MDLSSDPRTDPFNFLDMLRQQADATTQSFYGARAKRDALVRRAGGGSSGGGGGSYSGGDPRAYAQAQLAAYGWGPDQWGALNQLWQKESGWNPTAKNPSSGAYGIPQALPSNKIPGAENSTAQQQIDWGLQYIKQRYGDPNSAWGHSQATNWY